jgi:O-antigen/teichoic acid export membrane protein
MTYSLLGSFGFLVGVFQRVSFASFSRIKSEPDRLNRIAGKLLNFLEFFYVPLYFGLSAFASFWVPLVYGEKWSGMAELFLWWAVPMTLVALSTVFYASTLAGSRNRLVLYQNLLHASIFVGVLALLAPSLKALAWPIAHMAAVPAALLYVLSHRRHYGPLHLGRVFYGLVAGVVWMTSSHWLLLNDHPYAALAMALVFLGFWYFWLGKDLPIRRWAMGGREGGWDDLPDLSQKG